MSRTAEGKSGASYDATRLPPSSRQPGSSPSWRVISSAVSSRLTGRALQTSARVSITSSPHGTDDPGRGLHGRPVVVPDEVALCPKGPHVGTQRGVAASGRPVGAGCTLDIAVEGMVADHRVLVRGGESHGH